MFRIEGKSTIKIIQGDTGFLKVSLSNYRLSKGDRVTLSVINKDISMEYNLIPCIVKTITDFQPDGSAVIQFRPEDTQNLEPKTYSYDIQINTKDGRVDTVVPASKFIVLEGISK